MPENDNFFTQYSNLCLQSKVYPLRTVSKYLKGNELSCPVEAFRSEHWKILLQVLSTDTHLTKVHFTSYLTPTSPPSDHVIQKGRKFAYFPTPYGRSEENITGICKAVGNLLSVHNTLKILKLENLTLTDEDAELLSRGLKNSALEQFSLAGCMLGDDAVAMICRNLQTSSVEWLDLSSCCLSLRALESVCSVIKSHKVRRSTEMFEKTLRYQFPVFEDFKGLSRVSLNDNEFMDKGVNILVASLADDKWIKALDLQMCGIGSQGAIELLEVSKWNTELYIIDLRLNDVEDSLLLRISNQLKLNKVAKITKYELMPLWTPPRIMKRIPKLTTFKRKKVLKRPPQSNVRHSKPAIRRYGISIKNPELIKVEAISMEDASSQTVNGDECNEISGTVLDVLKKLKTSLTGEMKLRRYFMQQFEKTKAENQLLREELMKLNKKLSNQDDLVFIDHETFLDVKQTFEKFKRFLDIMKEYGLWEFIKLLGVNENANVILHLSPDSHKYLKVTQVKPVSTDSISDFDDPMAHGKHTGNDSGAKRRVCCNCHAEVGNKKPVKLQVQNGSIHSISMCGSKCPHVSVNGRCCVNSLDKASVQKVYKEVRNNYKESHQLHESKPIVADRMSGNIPPKCTGKPILKSNICVKKLPYTSVPSKLRELKSPAEFYKLLRSELEKCDCKYGLEKSSFSTKSYSSAKCNSKSQAKLSNDDTNYNQVSPSDVSSDKARDASNVYFSAKDSFKQQFSKKHSISSQSTLTPCIHPGKISKNKAASNRDHTLTPSDPPEKFSKTKGASCNDHHRGNKTLPNCNTESEVESLQSDMPMIPPLSPPVPSERQSSKTKKHAANLEKIKDGPNLVKQKKNSISSGNSSPSYEQSSNFTKSFASDSSVSSSISKKVDKDKRKKSMDHISSCQSISSVEEEDQKSYLESVSDASTDKDIKSFSDIEISLSAQSKKSCSLQKSEVVARNHLEHSTKIDEHSAKQDDSTKQNPETVDLSKHSSKLSKSSPKSQKLGSLVASEKSKDSSKKKEQTSLSLEKKGEQANCSKTDSRSASVPSLSDITTVSSRSLNTDSIMHQISESDSSTKK